MENCCKNRHENFKHNISDSTYEILEKLYYIIKLDNNKSCKYINQEIEGLKEKIFKLDGSLQSKDILLKSYILYNRSCILIEHLLNEYEDFNQSDKYEIIDYYLFDNRLKELNCTGLSWYYDCKFKPNSVRLFRSEGGTCNWENARYNFRLESNIKILKNIINSCREHINKGNYKIKLRSYSKCFGVVLFKYLSIPNGEGSVRLCFNEAVNTNVIVLNNKCISFQKFIANEEKNNSIDFCIDMTSVRDEKRDNLTRWMKRFLGDTSIEIQKMISPVSDKEVIMSYKPSNETYYDLNQEELIYLLYEYYKLYSEKILKSHNTFEKKFSDIMEEIKKFDNGVQYFEWINKCVCSSSDDAIKKTQEILSHIDWKNEKLSLDKGYENLYKGDSANPGINVFKMILHKYVV